MVAFNKRRAGEVSRMLTEDVKKMRVGDINPDIFQHLSPLEKKLAEVLGHFVIRGKRDRGVPVLLTPLMRQAIEILISDINRTIVNILPENKYFFASPATKDGYYNACTYFREFSVACGADNPSFLRSTNLRKHFASMCVLANLQENQLDVVCGFMGHTISVHRDFYRLPQNTLQVVMMGKMISAKEMGIDLRPKDVQLEEFIEVNETADSDDDDDDDDDVHVPSDSSAARKRKISPASGGHPAPKPKKCRTGGTQNTGTRKPWTKDENNAIQKYFGNFIGTSILPGKGKIEDVKKVAPVLNSRSWRNIKDKIRNMSM